ncbi:rod shape-determining protein MreC [Albibacterium bauzanense]|uniref:Cell shape-determining protein MreC n=1 Tax=Albibacterium bauzanense TaxID=653929 RepID=A0A4R1M1E3_9SPHI|nr:rod shape-determining protein MreC [Albibacterium bauzanense]TCK85475.1 rod shape-determining protein MreC [Albibacterium bauzanense]
MRNLWVFINRYSTFFLFILFFGGSIVLVVRNNTFQRASTINSSNQIIGSIYQQVDYFKGYLSLNETNLALARENAALRALLKSSNYDNKVISNVIRDSTQQPEYSYIQARVINNSVNQKNNYITVNRGARHGIKKGMGVISSKGIVGIVLNVSENFSTIQSLLHSDTKISASLAKSQAFGSLVWGTQSSDPQKALLRDIPNHVKVENKEQVITSGFSLFPPGIVIGTVLETGLSSGSSFLDISVLLNNDFSTLRYVYVIVDKYSEEKEALEIQNLDND